MLRYRDSLTKNDLVGLEAILNITDKKWSLFLCILGLSTVLHRNIYTYYPLLFNQFVKSRENAKHTGGDIHILFCHEGILGPGEVFQPNHKFVFAGHALHFLFDYPFKNPRSAPD